MTKLSEIVDSVLAADGKPTDNQAFHNFVYRNIDVRRSQSQSRANPHLENPLNEGLGGFSARAVALTGQEDVFGDYLAIQFGTHDDMVLLLDHESLVDMEKFILSNSGVFNPFVDWIYAFIFGELVLYSISFDLNGKTLFFSKEKQFNCSFGNQGASDLRPYKKRKIQWYRLP